jgi:anti-sigma factor ChrR (cupin superfamily)
MPGISLLPLAGGLRVAEAPCTLACIASGSGLPRHRHQGDERTRVLQVWVQEDDKRYWGPGDRLHRAPGSVHAFYAMELMPCVCALVSHGDIEIVAARSEAGEEQA